MSAASVPAPCHFNSTSMEQCSHRKSNQLTSRAVSQTSHSSPPSFQGLWKILFSAALTSDIRRQASDLCSKCCTSKQELRIPDECRGSLSSVKRRVILTCGGRHVISRCVLLWRHLQKTKKQSSWWHRCCERHLPKTWFKGPRGVKRTQDFSHTLHKF